MWNCAPAALGSLLNASPLSTGTSSLWPDGRMRNRLHLLICLLLAVKPPWHLKHSMWQVHPSTLQQNYIDLLTLTTTFASGFLYKYVEAPKLSWAELSFDLWAAQHRLRLLHVSTRTTRTPQWCCSCRHDSCQTCDLFDNRQPSGLIPDHSGRLTGLQHATRHLRDVIGSGP